MLFLNISRNFNPCGLRHIKRITANQMSQMGIFSHLTNKKREKKFLWTRAKVNHNLKRFFINSLNSNKSSGAILPPLIDNRRDPPSLLDLLRSYYYHNFVLSKIDEDFNMPDFLNGAQQVMEVISSALSQENYGLLEGLIDDELLNLLKKKISTLTQDQKDLIPISREDVYKHLILVNMIYSQDRTEKTIAQIFVTFFHCQGIHLNKDKDIAEMGSILSSGKNCLSYYVFERDYTNGNKASWQLMEYNQWSLSSFF